MIYRMTSYKGIFTDDACDRFYRSLDQWWASLSDERRLELQKIERHLPNHRLTFWPVRLSRTHPSIEANWRMSPTRLDPVRRYVALGGVFYWKPLRDPLVITVGEVFDLIDPHRVLGT